MGKEALALVNRLMDHYRESTQHFDTNQIVGIFCQGSQNYGLDLPESDLDTKLIVVPTFREIAMNSKPVSTTHIRANEEHIDFKDIRLYMETFRKQNLNFLEILFTPYYILSPQYHDQWNRLIAQRESIARMNPYRAVKSMKGIAMEKYHAMEHEYPSKIAVLARYHYDPKQLHHLKRVEEYLERYIVGESYEACLHPIDPEFLKDIKRGKYTLEEAREMANKSIARVIEISNAFCEKTPEAEDKEMRALLEDVQYHVMEIAIKGELKV